VSSLEAIFGRNTRRAEGETPQERNAEHRVEQLLSLNKGAVAITGERRRVSQGVCV